MNLYAWAIGAFAGCGAVWLAVLVTDPSVLALAAFCASLGASMGYTSAFTERRRRLRG